MAKRRPVCPAYALLQSGQVSLYTPDSQHLSEVDFLNRFPIVFVVRNAIFLSRFPIVFVVRNAIFLSRFPIVFVVGNAILLSRFPIVFVVRNAIFFK